MGLDMYLKANKYVGGWNHNTDKEYKPLCDIMGISPTEDSPSFDVFCTVGYWRKANAIHNWFVKNVQEGNDDCGDYFVSRENLQLLKEDCEKVLNSIETVNDKIPNGTTYHFDGRVEERFVDGEVIAQPGLASKILPTASGFFFGDTGYNSYYIQDLKDTISIIDKVMTLGDDWSFYYHSSW